MINAKQTQIQNGYIKNYFICSVFKGLAQKSMLMDKQNDERIPVLLDLVVRN